MYKREKKQANKNVFFDADKAFKQKNYRKVLDCLLEENGARLNKKYRVDGNHAWYMIGIAYYKEGCYLDALVSLKKSILNRSDDIQALFAIGNCYSDLNIPKLAERYFRRALSSYFYPHGKIGLTKYDIIYNLANSLFDQALYKEAFDLYLEIDNPDSKAYKYARKNIELIKTYCDVDGVIPP